ncbi:MAG TPA: aspartate aminotransferase family protein [Chthonomonadaceae bacterium]|nr:aspartate aminotransferase family protein [Chthonomonadaceae bacterium]
MDRDQVLQWNDEGLLAEVLGYETTEVADRALAAHVETLAGAHYLDFTSGIAVHALGHTHPNVVKAIQDQAASVIHTSDVMRHAPQLALAHWLRERLAAAVPGEPWSVQFMNSGSESIDAAAKLALKATGRSKFIAFRGAFHGRTLFATALSLSNLVHRRAYEPLLARLDEAILRAPAPRAAPGDPSCADAVEALVEQNTGEVAALFFEPQQGEGGYFPMLAGVAARLREITRAHGILMIADEIQTGFGRTGRWFDFERLGIAPDILVFGKAVGGGLPLAGIAAPSSVMAKWVPGEHGTTFGGNPVACAAGLAAMRGIEKDGLVAKAAQLGDEVKSRLGRLVGSAGVHDVRGNGLMIGIEFRDRAGHPDYARVAAVKAACRERGVLVLSCGARIGDLATDNAAIRLLPPLNVSREDLERGLTALEESIAATA